MHVSHCQSSRFAFIFQAFIYPGSSDGYIQPPEGYTGEWRTWYFNGRLRYIENFIDGELNGDRYTFMSSGIKVFQATYRNGAKDGLCIEWNEKGEKIHERIIKNREGCP